MLYFLRENKLVYKDINGSICFTAPTPTLTLDSALNEFIPTEYYNETAHFIANCMKQANCSNKQTLVLNATYFKLPGFVQAIINYASPELLIHSDIDFIINTQALKPGAYTLMDILNNEINIYKFEVTHNRYIIYSKERMESSSVKQIIADKLKKDVSDYDFFTTLFSFQNILAVNNYLETNKIPKEDFAYLNFADADAEINKYTNTDLSAFFESIALAIQYASDTFISSDTIAIVKSPLTSYSPVYAMIGQHPRRMVLKELELYGASVKLNSISGTPDDVSIKLNIFPKSQKVRLPFAGWFLSEMDDLNFEMTKANDNKNNTVLIPLSALQNKLALSSFYTGSKELVKYLMELKEDCCNNLHLVIQTVDKKEFHYLIKD